jgi:osmoprotectant transport system permease protein
MHFLSQVVDWFTTASNWQGTDGVIHRLLEHLTLTAVPVLAAIVVALPIALWLGHLGKGGYAVINLANVGRAVPAFALLVIGFDIFGLGSTPVYLALFALSVPPILTNAYVAMRQVDPDIKEAAGGMGMTGWQMVTRAEVPVALPLIFAGIRTATVQALATATLGAVVGAGGLGRLIYDGMQQGPPGHVQEFAGAVLVAVLALLAEVGLAAVQRWITPAGLQVSPRHARKIAPLPGAAAAPEREAA